MSDRVTDERVAEIRARIVVNSANVSEISPLQAHRDRSDLLTALDATTARLRQAEGHIRALLGPADGATTVSEAELAALRFLKGAANG